MNTDETSTDTMRWRSLRRSSGRVQRWLQTFQVPILFSLIFALIFAVPEQFQELYRIMAGDVVFAFLSKGEAHGWYQIFIVSVSSFLPPLVSVIILTTAVALSARILEVLGRGAGRPANPFWHGYYNYSPLAVGILPVLGCVWGIYAALSSSVKKDISLEAELLAKLGDNTLASTHSKYIDFAEIVDSVLIWMAGTLILWAVLFVTTGILVYRRTNIANRLFFWIKKPVLFFVFATVILAAIYALIEFPVVLPQFLGVFGIIAAFGVVITIFSSFLIVQSQRIGFPIIGFLIFLVLLFTLFDLNDNHQLRYTKGGQDKYPSESEIATASPLPEVKESFLPWLKSRNGITFEEPKDKNTKGTWATNTGKKFPVYIVAAQGGGIYAAAQANFFLSQTTATCEQFPQHLFAISSVSGGSIGAAAFSAALTKFGRKDATCISFEEIKTPNRNTFSPAVQSVLAATYQLAQEDWLSPLIGAALFPDFAQRFWLQPIPQLSRERALEAALEESWRRLYLGSEEQNNPLRKGVVASWDPKGIRPALLLNTTETGSGRRRVIAPFRFELPNDSDLQFFPLSKEYDVSLSAAAVASARFPYITPAAWFWRGNTSGGDKAAETNKGQNNSRVRIVDGGYFENSGVATASDLVARLEKIVSDHEIPVQIHMIVLTYGRYPQRKSYAFGELLAPVRSLLNTRESRTLSTIALADRDLGTIESAEPVRRLQRVTLTDFYTPLPLGWRLSKIGVLQIRRGMSRIPYCYPDKAFVQNANTPALGDGNCVARLIWHQLRGDDIIDAREQVCRQAEARSKEAGGNFNCEPN